LQPFAPRRAARGRQAVLVTADLQAASSTTLGTFASGAALLLRWAARFSARVDRRLENQEQALGKLDTSLAELRQELAAAAAELRQELAEQRKELRQELAEQSKELAEQRKELRQELAEQRKELLAAVAASEARVAAAQKPLVDLVTAAMSALADSNIQPLPHAARQEQEEAEAEACSGSDS
jgi:septal ring factor EnvC (AmiA/AmiB activator)